MSKDKLNDLIKLYPDYSQVFRAVLNWFLTHPQQRSVTMDFFYSNKFAFSKEQINIAFFIMKETEVVKPIYRILDDKGHKIGRDYDNVEEIPKYVDTMWGDKKDIDEVYIVPYYELI